MQVFWFLPSSLRVYKYRTWIAVLESRIFDLWANILAISTWPWAWIILLSAFLLAMGADTSSDYRSLPMAKYKSRKKYFWGVHYRWWSPSALWSVAPAEWYRASVLLFSTTNLEKWRRSLYFWSILPQPWPEILRGCQLCRTSDGVQPRDSTCRSRLWLKCCLDEWEPTFCHQPLNGERLYDDSAVDDTHFLG